jgi:nicotinamidase-related amidase
VAPDVTTALLTIDVQRDFYASGALVRIAGTQECLPAMRQVAHAFRRSDRPIVHVVRLYAADGSNAEPVRRPLVTTTSIVRPGTPGSQLAPELLPDGGVELDADLLLAGRLQQVGEAEWLMYKPRWGAFYRTPLEEHLRRLGVEALTIVGCNFPNCPRTTIYEASERDFATTLVADAVSGTYDRGLEELSGIGTRIVTAAAISSPEGEHVVSTPPDVSRSPRSAGTGS